VDPSPGKLHSDGIPPVHRSKPGELFFFRIQVIPHPDNPEAQDAGGAFANCWVDADDLRTAEIRAIEVIQGNGWCPQSLDEWKLVWRECYKDGHEARQSIDEAFRDGSNCTFFVWPVDAPDRSGEHD